MDDLLDLNFSEDLSRKQNQQQHTKPSAVEATSPSIPLTLEHSRPASAASTANYTALRAAEPTPARQEKKNSTGKDSFASLVSFSSSKARDAANRPLNEQEKARQQVAFGSTANPASIGSDWAAGLSFDLLDNFGSSSTSKLL